MNTGIRRIGVRDHRALRSPSSAQLTYLQVGRSQPNSRTRPATRASSSPTSGAIAGPDRGRLNGRDRGALETDRRRVQAPNACTRTTTATQFADVVGYESIQHGAVGVENAYSSTSRDGRSKLQLNNLGRRLRETSSPWATVVLTMSKIGGRGRRHFSAARKSAASVVVLDVKTGGVLARVLETRPTIRTQLAGPTMRRRQQAAFLGAGPTRPGKPVARPAPGASFYPPRAPPSKTVHRVDRSAEQRRPCQDVPR